MRSAPCRALRRRTGLRPTAIAPRKDNRRRTPVGSRDGLAEASAVTQAQREREHTGRTDVLMYGADRPCAPVEGPMGRDRLLTVPRMRCAP